MELPLPWTAAGLGTSEEVQPPFHHLPLLSCLGHGGLVFSASNPCQFLENSSKSLSVFGTPPCFTHGPAALRTRQAHGSSFPGGEPVLFTTDREQCKLRG